MIRRLTTRQLQNAVEDLFDAPGAPRVRGLEDPVNRGYDVDASAVIRDLGAQQIMQWAEESAAWGVQNHIDAVSSCDSGAACRIAFQRYVGRRLYRRPIEDDELLAYDGMWEDQMTFEEGAMRVVRTMLQSPHFLYRIEIGEPVEGEPDVVRLTRWELATELAFLATDAPPDDELLDAAAAGELSTPEGIDAQLARLLATPRGRAALARFAIQWLDVGELASAPKDPSVPFDETLRAAMLQEAGALFLDVHASGGGIGALFGATHTFVNGPLAEHYGLDAPAEWTRVEPANRAPGVLGLGAVLATHARADGSSPTQRGALVRRRLLCENLPDPPPDVDTTLGDVEGARTTRERYARHATDARCNECHARIDPIGFALEGYDGFARHRTQENGVPIDATGTIVASRDGDVGLDGAASLTDYLGQSPEARACFAEHLAYWAYGVEGCTYATLTDELDADTPLSELVRRLVHTRHFTMRRASTH